MDAGSTWFQKEIERRIRDIAEDRTNALLANAAYEQYMSAYNDLYKAFRANLTDKQARMVFVARVAPSLLEEARLVLTDCLAQSEDECSTYMKEQIVDALVKDTDFRANRTVAAQHARMN